MVRLMRSFRFLAMLLAISLLSTSAGIAAAPQPAKQRLAQIPQPEIDLAQRISPFIDFTANGITFDEKAAIKAGVDKKKAAEFAASYAEINKSLNAEKFNWIGLKTDLETHSIFTQNEENVTAGALLTRGGMTPDATYRKTWTYSQWTFTERETRLIVGAVKAPGAISTVLTLLTKLKIPSWVTLAAALITFGAWYVDYVDTIGNNRGVYVRLFVGVQVPFIWHN